MSNNNPEKNQDHAEVPDSETPLNNAEDVAENLAAEETSNAEHHLAEAEVAEHFPAENHPAEHHLAEAEVAEHLPAENHPAEHHLAEAEVAEHLPAENHPAEHHLAEAEVAEHHLAQSVVAKASAEFVVNAERYHSSVEEYVGGEDRSAEIANSSEEMMTAAETIMAEAEILSPSAEKALLKSAEIVMTSAEHLGPAATGFSTAEGAEQMAEASAEMVLGAEELDHNFSRGIRKLTKGTEDLFKGAELVADAETLGAESFSEGATGFFTSTRQIIPNYSAAGSVTDQGAYYNTAGVFMLGAENVLNGAEELSPLPSKGLPNLDTDIERLQFSADQLVSEVNSSYPLQLEGAEMIAKSVGKLTRAYRAGEDMVDAAEDFFKGAEVYVNINAESVEEFDAGSAEVELSAEEYATNPKKADQHLLKGAEEIKVSSNAFKYLGAESGAEVGGEDFIVGSTGDVAELYVGNPEDLMPAAEVVLTSAEQLATHAENAMAEDGAAELIHGAENLIAASELVNGGEEASIKLNSAAAEVLAGAEEFIKGNAEEAIA